MYTGRGYVYFFPPGGLEGPLGLPQKSAGGRWAAGALQPLFQTSSTFLFSWCLGGSTALPSVSLHNFPAYEGESWQLCLSRLSRAFG